MFKITICVVFEKTHCVFVDVNHWQYLCVKKKIKKPNGDVTFRIMWELHLKLGLCEYTVSSRMNVNDNGHTFCRNGKKTPFSKTSISHQFSFWLPEWNIHSKLSVCWCVQIIRLKLCGVSGEPGPYADWNPVSYTHLTLPTIYSV